MGVIWGVGQNGAPKTKCPFWTTLQKNDHRVNFGGTFEILAQSDHHCAGDGISQQIDSCCGTNFLHLVIFIIIFLDVYY